MSRFPPFYAPILDQETVRALWATKPPDHATHIIAGRGIATAIDINKWRNLGAKAWRKHSTTAGQWDQGKR